MRGIRKPFMQDIDTTGGFVKKWTEGPPGESSRTLWQSTKKNAKLPINFFGCPFKSVWNYHYECVHAGQKRVHTKNPLESFLHDHPGAAKKKRLHIRDTKKLGCTADLVVKKILYYPEYQIDVSRATAYMERKLKSDELHKLDNALQWGKWKRESSITWKFH